MNLKTLSFIDSLSPDARQEFIKYFDLLLNPLKTMKASIETLYLSFKSEGTALRRIYYGIDDLDWAEWIKRDMNEIYPRYLEKKGTKSGLQLMAEKLLTGAKIDIVENYAPGPAFVLGQSSIDTDYKLSSHHEKQQSFLMKIEPNGDRNLTQLLKEKKQDFEKAIRSDTPLNTKIYFIYSELGE